jgi:hypothetical protein
VAEDGTVEGWTMERCPRPFTGPWFTHEPAAEEDPKPPPSGGRTKRKPGSSRQRPAQGPLSRSPEGKVKAAISRYERAWCLERGTVGGNK